MDYNIVPLKFFKRSILKIICGIKNAENSNDGII